MPAAFAQTANWQKVTDNTTGDVTYVCVTPYEAYTAPQISGYLSENDTLAAGINETTTQPPVLASSYTFVYQAASQTLNIKYVDDDDSGVQVGETQILNGKTAETVSWTAEVPSGYALAAGQTTSGQATLTAGSNEVVIHLQHLITHASAETTRTITYTGAGAETPDQVVQTIHWSTSTDEVTGAFVATPQTVYETVDTPVVSGYEPDQASVDRLAPEVLTDVTALKNVNATVNYAPTAQVLTVKYEDDDSRGVQVGKIQILNGKTGETVSWTAEVPTGYVLVAGQSTSGQATLTTGSNEVVIHLQHIITHDSAKTTRTITYTGASDPTPAPVEQTISWSTSTDEVTGGFVATPQDVYETVDTPVVSGYEPDQASVNRLAPEVLTDATALKNVNVMVNYEPTDRVLKVEYVDDDNQGAKVGDGQTLNGKTGETVSWTADVPTGYALASGQATSGQAILSTWNNEVVIHLQHLIAHSTAETTRTITYTGANDQTPDPVVQTITWLTSTDEVTGAFVATPQNAYYAVESPKVSGYTPSQMTVYRVGENPISSSADLKNSMVAVHYQANRQRAEIIFVNENGVHLDEITVSGDSDSSILPASYAMALNDFLAKGYQLVADHVKGANFDHDDSQDQHFEIVLKNLDAGNPDTGNPDTGNPDTGNPDTGNPDTGNPDTGNPDTGNPDTGNPDTGNPELGNPVTGNPDTSNPDTGNPDTGNPDTGNPDTGNPDTGNPDTSNPEPDNPDTGNPDTGNPEPGNPVTGNPDTSNPEPGNPDTSNPDTDNPAGGNPDTGNPDTGNPDTGNPDTGNPQAGNANLDLPRTGKANSLDINAVTSYSIPASRIGQQNTKRISAVANDDENNRLPHTGDHRHSLLAALGLLLVSGMTALAGVRRKHE